MHGPHIAIYVSHEPGQNFAGTDFDKSIDAILNEQLNRFAPAYRRGNLSDKCVADFVAGFNL
jgi:hypothetical protein